MNHKQLYNKGLRKFAQSNRNNSTKAEVLLWLHVLKAGKTGYKFRRQRPVLNYIADFMCKELSLIIELDGFTHLSDFAKAKDAVRQKILEENGFTLIRFNDCDVLVNMDWVKEKIIEKIKELESLPRHN